MNNLLLSTDPCERPIGGIQYIELLPSVAIASMARPSGLGFSGPLTLKAGWSWIRVELFDDTPFFSEDDANTTNGTTYEIKFGGFYPRDTQQIVEQLELMKRYFWIARVKDNDDRWRLVGNQSQTVKFMSRSYKINTPQQLRGFQLEFSGVFSRPALFDNR